MKIDRLLGIVTILLQRDKVTAPELARKFEVSRRTIHRDIDDLCKAGIPVVTYQGGDGGISIADGFKLDKSVLSVEELQSILAGLRSISSVTGSPRVERLMEKLAPKREAVVSVKDHILIDLSSHYKASLSDKIGLMQTAISGSKLVSFDYYSDRGVAVRTIEPYYITFRWSSWYVFGYCRTRNAFRLFKLNRLWKHRLAQECFVPREIPAEELELDSYFHDENRITIVFDRSVEYLLVEEYGPDSYTVTEEGKLKFSVEYTNRDYMIGWVLGFGDKAKVVEPADMAHTIREKAKNILQQYEHDI